MLANFFLKKDQIKIWKMRGYLDQAVYFQE